MFGNQPDDCKRGDTDFVEALISNRAKGSCTLTASTPVTDVLLTVPELLGGAWSIKDSIVVIMFRNPETRAAMHLSDPDLDHDWGGNIVAAYADAGYVGFSVGEKSCVWASLPKEE
jgi:hypothetical protein